MLLALSKQISKIDRLAEEKWGIPVRLLMERSGRAVADAVKARVPFGSDIIIFAGKGNNGGDGYAAACMLAPDYNITVFDVFSAGQKSESGRYFLELFKSSGGCVVDFVPSAETERRVKRADCIIDAIFGTGFCGEIPENVIATARYINETVSATKIAIDVPIGVNADTGSVNTTSACPMSATVALSFIKPGLVSYPAKSFVGELVFDNLSLPIDEIRKRFEFKNVYIDSELAKELLPKREANTSKGDFGRLLCITGSQRYRGAAHLSLEAALRGGAGYVTYLGIPSLADELLQKYPEAIYSHISDFDSLGDDEIERIRALSKKSSATLIGSGSYDTDGLYSVVLALLSDAGGALILDADAINAMSRHRQEALTALRESPRRVILTPHPLEFARLSGNDVSDVQLHRIEVAVKFAKEYGCVVVLKGAGTVVTDGDRVYINSSGSSALAKAGSGDVLAGALASLVASGAPAIEVSAAAVYYHGAAADVLARELSVFGVIPSELPRQIARQIALDAQKR